MKRLILILIALMLLLSGSSQAAQIKLTWNANTEPDLSGYRIHYGTASGQYSVPVDVGNVTEHTLTLTPQYGTTYYFVLTASDTSGNESGYSNEVSVFVPDSTAPAPPKGLLARIIDVLMSWFKGLFGLTSRIV
jgi:fibronectin type 3 domain-containing protein